MDRETLAWALVFSVPVAIGITGYTAFVLRGDAINALSVLVGAAVGLVLFALVAYAGSGGSADERRRNEDAG